MSITIRYEDRPLEVIEKLDNALRERGLCLVMAPAFEKRGVFSLPPIVVDIKEIPIGNEQASDSATVTM